MIIGKVVGTVVTTMSHPDLKNKRLLTIRPLTMDKERDAEEFIAVDTSYAGINDVVIVVREGNGVRGVLNVKKSCINSIVVGIVDSVSLQDVEITSK